MIAPANIGCIVGFGQRERWPVAKTSVHFFCFDQWFMFPGWWFGTFFMFPYIWNNHPNGRSYFSEGLKPPTIFFWGAQITMFAYQASHILGGDFHSETRRNRNWLAWCWSQPRQLQLLLMLESQWPNERLSQNGLAHVLESEQMHQVLELSLS